MIKINERDIENVENKFNLTFDEERRTAILNLKTTDIVACAGSGKTTMMCAKIDILTNKQPFSNNKGIAVLSLTNVAIEQIKNKLGNEHNIFKYPNYCETIQKFVTKYVLNSWYNLMHNKKIEAIDNDFFVLRFKEKVEYKKIKYLEKINFIFEDIYTDGVDIFYNEQKIEDKQFARLRNDTNREYINEIKNAKLQLIDEGILNYRDAFEIATRYLKENKRLKEYIKQRFQFCFVDEMQDCRKWEKNFLDECFSDICFQRIGDPNQQIYENTYWFPSNYIKIDKSIRNSVNIAEFARKFEDLPNEMIGNIQNNIKVKIFLYNTSNISNVKDKFIEEIKKEKLNERKDAIFKIIGKVYKENSNGKIELSNFCGCTNEIENYNMFFNKTLQQNNNRIMATFIDVMYYLYIKIDKKNKENIKNKKEFCNKINAFINREDLYKKLKNITKEKLIDFSKKYFKKILINIFSNKDYFSNTYDEIINKKENNTVTLMPYIKDGVKVDFNTIAGVKGETHTATLVCETFYRYYDIEYILNKYIKHNTKTKTSKDFLHSTYVAFTRPTDMLCIAIREEVYNKFKEEIDKFNVEVIKI